MTALYGLLLLAAAPDLWLKRVEPVMSNDERTLYSSLTDEKAREVFRTGFWSSKSITETEYFERIQFIDAKFGSTQPGSGANTDQGRIYLSLGAPNSISRLPSSRIFQPTEIWAYDRYRFLFFGDRMKLYSPQIHTIRALIIPNAGTRGLFPVNDVITETDVRERLNLTPAEQDVVEAAMAVGRGIRGSGNSEVLYLASSPREMLSRARSGAASSRIRFEGERPKIETKQFATPNKIPALDLTFTGSARNSISVEIRDLEAFTNPLNFDSTKPFTYTQRVYLLPGEYTILVEVDGFRTGYVVNVAKLSPTDPPADPHYPGADWASIGKQYLMFGDTSRAQTCFKRALVAARSVDALVGTARLTKDLDQARNLLTEALAIQPNHFEALLTLAAITAEFQDYPLARSYYQRALTIRPSPAIEEAIRQLKN
ncbi:MAG: GWxTD domain-containing protein [Acidobacteria bacterium]|nr:GWxTD domain-containing protein [Acidobacteriota bacterium]